MLKLLSLFSGIGAFEKALENIGEPFKVVRYCEIDKYASKAYSLIHNIDENLNLKDVCSIKTEELPNDIDLITYGFPCQDISNAGKQKGFTDEQGNLTRSGLFFEALRIIEDTQPKIAIAENVKALVEKKFTAEFKIVLDSLNEAGYTNYWAVLNAKDYGIPQNRERVFIVSIRNDIDHGFTFPKKYELKLRLKDLLEESVDEKYYLSDKMIQGFLKHNLKHEAKGTGFKWNPTDTNGIAKCLRANAALCPTDNTIDETNTTVQKDSLVAKNLCIRKLTPKECFRLMGFDDEDVDILIKNGISNTQLYKMAGNSICVDVLEELFVELLNQYNNLKE